MLAFACLVAFYGLGEWIKQAFLIPLPGALIGLLLLFIMLMLIRKVPATLQTTSQFLLRHLSIFFIPATLSVILFKDSLLQHFWLISATLVGSTLLSLAISAVICQHCLKSDDHD